MLDLSRDSDLAAVRQSGIPSTNLSMEAVSQQVRNNRRKELAARSNADGSAPMVVDTPAATPSGADPLQRAPFDSFLFMLLHTCPRVILEETGSGDRQRVSGRPPNRMCVSLLRSKGKQ
jgi:hypothetical protein